MISRSSLVWATGAFAAGILLNLDHVPPWASAAAVLFIAWRLLAATRPSAVQLPGTLVKGVLALALVALVLIRFRTLNGLSAGTALLLLMGAIKLLETRSQRDLYIVIGAGLFLLLAACLNRQDLVLAPLYLAHAWLCCAALAVAAHADGKFGGRDALVLAGRSLLFAAPLALVLFLFFPRLPGSFWALPRSDQATTGLGDTMNPGTIERLTASYDTAFRARFDGKPPPRQELYWRGPVLHEFDGSTWSRNPGSYYRQQRLEYLGPAYRYRISLEPSSRRWWFALDTVIDSPDPKVFFTYDYQLIASEPVTQVTSYTATSHTHTRTSDLLSPSARRRDTALPANRNPRSRELARELRARASSEAAFVDAALEFLRKGGFQYSLTPPRLSSDSVDDLLFNTRSGFCGHYASAFVSLMRAAGLPAHVVTGYLGGEWNPVGGYFIVRQSDAHAWAEVWLEGRGWTRVDPTAVVEPERLSRDILDLLPDAGSAPARLMRSIPWLESALQRWDALNTWWNDRVVKFNYGDQLRILERLGFDSPSARELGWMFAAGLVVWLAWVAWHLGRGVRGARPDRLAGAYARLCSKLARVGLPRIAHQGPLAYADSVAGLRPDLAPKIRPLVMRYVQLRYDPPAADQGATELARFERAVSRLRITRLSKAARAPRTASPSRAN